MFILNSLTNVSIKKEKIHNMPFTLYTFSEVDGAYFKKNNNYGLYHN